MHQGIFFGDDYVGQDARVLEVAHVRLTSMFSGSISHIDSDGEA